MKLLTPEDAAEVLAVSRSTILRMIADGALPAICLRSGRRKKVLRIRQEILEKWVLTKEKETTKRRAQAPTAGSAEIAEFNGQVAAAIACESSAA